MTNLFKPILKLIILIFITAFFHEIALGNENTQEKKSTNDSIESLESFHPIKKIKVRSISGKIADVSVRINNQDYYYLKNNYQIEGISFLFFEAQHNQPIAEVRVFPLEEGSQINGLKLLTSSDYEILDTLLFVNNNHYRARIRFNNITESAYPVILLRYNESENLEYNKEIKLAPYFLPGLIYDDTSVELFIGEEKTIEISGSNLFNIELSPEWQSINKMEYKLIRSGNILKLTVRANNTGDAKLPLNIKTISPIIKEGIITNDLETVELRFNVKPSRLLYLNTDKNIVFAEPDRRKSEEIRLDYHSSFELRKNYRIEDRQEPGGILIAELYVKSITSDNKVLADIKTYDLHRVSDGYLYIKDGTRTLFMTNFNVLNHPEISKIEILREGRDWTSSLNVFPGEKIEVKVEGNGLLDANITFDGCTQKKDSIRQSDRILFFEITIPLNIPRRKIMVFLNQTISQHELLVREYQRPADLDFVKINYGTRNYEITSTHFNQPVFYDNTIRDINIVFDTDKIDNNERLHGKQFLTIEVRILDDNNRLLDFQTISNIVICPGESSPRHAFYGESDCKEQTIRLNDHLLRKTYNLDAFSQIIITVKHSDNHYSNGGKSQKAIIFIERKISFDIMVSFPAGLLVKEFSQSGIGNLSGISTSVLAEISFYDSKRIGKKKPYKFGAGFIALNAFNFGESENIKRDIGLVGIAVIEPIRGSAKFSVPIYLGFGYLLKENDFFAIFGPGIRLHF
jgi:hypothetical protein